MVDKLMTTEELAEYLNLSKAALYAMIWRGQVPYLRIGRRVRFRRESVEEWLAEGCPPAEKNQEQEDADGQKKQEA